MIHEYAFDVKLFAVIRVNASNETEARRVMQEVVDCIALNYEDAEHGVNITEASLSVEDGEPDLFEIDGEPEEQA